MLVSARPLPSTEAGDGCGAGRLQSVWIAHPSELQNQDGGTAVIMFQNAAVKGSLDPMQRARYDGRTMDTAPGAGRPVEL